MKKDEEQLNAAAMNSSAGAGVDETGEGTAEAPALSDLDYLRSRTAGRHGDMQFDDDDAYYKQMRADADEDDAELAEHRANNDKINQMFASDPRAADFWNEWQKHPDRNPIAYMIRVYGMDGVRDALDNPDFADEFEKANKDYLDLIAENKNYVQQVDSNLDKTLDMAEAYAQKNGMSTEEVDALLQKVFDRYKRIHLGEVTEDDLDWVRKAENHDADVEQAGREGEVRGRNSKIREQLRQRQTDAMPSLSGTAAAASVTAPPSIQTGREQYNSGNTPASQAPEVRRRRN